MFIGSITRPVLCKLEINHQLSNESEPKRLRWRPLMSLVYLLVFQMLVVTLLLPVCLRLTQLMFCQSVWISALLTCTLVRISSQRHLSRDEGLK